ncbi:MAG: divalent metal cation transporter [Bacteroidetes bacterium]|nr:divalent metal cation transporter [Bacteroidota bacterium]
MKPHKKKRKKNRFMRFLSTLGPGLTTGAADDDPSGIATYSQTGAQFGFGLLWTAFYMLPFMMGVQEACARIGMVTGKGIAAILKDNYSKWLVYSVIVLVLVANIINIGADIGAMASAARLLLPLSFIFWTVLFTVIILILQIFTTYKVYARILKWLALSLLAYPVTVFIAKMPWITVLKATFIPHIEFNFAYFFIITGVLGTTISPYLFFWETSQEAEELKELKTLKNGQPQVTRNRIRHMRIDNNAGMIISEITTWSILVVAGAVLHSNGITNINTAADAAKALEPLVHSFAYAGFLSKFIFSIGIIGLGFLAIPVLSGSAAYAVCEAANWESGLNLKLSRAHGFYGVIICSTLVGLLLNFIGINPVKALVYAAVLNGVAAVPLIFLIIRISGSEKIMKKYKSGLLSKVILWITFLGMSFAAIAMFASL